MATVSQVEAMVLPPFSPHFRLTAPPMTSIGVRHQICLSSFSLSLSLSSEDFRAHLPPPHPPQSHPHHPSAIHHGFCRRPSGQFRSNNVRIHFRFIPNSDGVDGTGRKSGIRKKSQIEPDALCIRRSSQSLNNKKKEIIICC